MMTGRKLWMTGVAMAAFMVTVTSYPRGAPDGACATLVPSSHGPSTATGPSPYSLELSSSTYSPNQVITRSVSWFVTFPLIDTKSNMFTAEHKPPTTMQGNVFRVSSEDNVYLGMHTSNYLPHGGQTGNGITQTNNTVKATSEFQWRAPSASVGVINFYFTVIRGGAPNTSPKASDYYANLISGSLTPAGFHEDLSEKEQKEKVKTTKHENKDRYEGFSFEEIIHRTKPFNG